MRRNISGLILFVVVLAVAAFAVIAVFSKGRLRNTAEKEAEVSVDPHEGMVYIWDGFNFVWMTPEEGVPVNTIGEEDMTLEGGVPVYTGSAYTAERGIDVSEHQYNVDWNAVKNSGISFAYIRAGRRGCTEGGLFKDPWFETNFEGAKAAGLKVGVYFFSQAVNATEAAEEAEFLLDIIKDKEIDLPVAYDLERVENEPSTRIDGLIDRETGKEKNKDLLTSLPKAFLTVIEARGYKPCLYLNRVQGYYWYHMKELSDYMLWVSNPLIEGDSIPRFYYSHDIWQYTTDASVPGVEGPVDVNLMFVPKTEY